MSKKGSANIKVFLRVRPTARPHSGFALPDKELENDPYYKGDPNRANGKQRVRFDLDSNPQSDEQDGPNNTRTRYDFAFDGIFGMDATQEEVFNQVAGPVINDGLHGLNGTIFAYGQTGSGKSFTMEGNEREVPDNYTGQVYHGITQRGVKELFEQIETVR